MMTEITVDPDRYAAITLAKGAHGNPGDGMCLMEAVAFLAGERFSDRPACVSPVLGEFGRSLNDLLPTPQRQELVALIPSLVGTAGDGYDVGRGFMALDWLARVCVPAYLDLVPECRDQAVILRGLARIADRVATQRAYVILTEAATTACASSATARHYAAATALVTVVSGMEWSAIDLFAEMIKAPWPSPGRGR